MVLMEYMQLSGVELFWCGLFLCEHGDFRECTTHAWVFRSLEVSQRILFFFAGVKRRAALCESAFYECYAQVYPSISNSIPICCCQCRVPYFRLTCEPTRAEDGCSNGSSLGHHAMLGLNTNLLLSVIECPLSTMCFWNSCVRGLCVCAKPRGWFRVWCLLRKNQLWYALLSSGFLHHVCRWKTIPLRRTLERLQEKWSWVKNLKLRYVSCSLVFWSMFLSIYAYLFNR